MPVGRGKYELYSEAEDRDEPPASVATKGGRLQRLVAHFRAVLATVERDQEHREADAASGAGQPSLGQRLKARLLRWLAERIAEQRLLWHLRGQHAARLHRPADLDTEAAERVLFGILKRDADRHLIWGLVAGVAFVASGLIAWLPGPNLIAYYFAFRLVGHFLSMRGARNGLRGVRWSIEPSEPLAELGTLSGLPPSVRAERVRAIADSLGLERLPRFFARTASPIS